MNFNEKKKEKRTTITFNEDAWPKKKEKRNNNKVRLGSLISCNYQTRWRLYERRISVRSLGPPPPHLPLLFISRFRRVLFFCFGGRKNTFPSRSSSFRFLYHCPGVLFYCFLADSIIHGVSTPLEMFFLRKKTGENLLKNKEPRQSSQSSFRERLPKMMLQILQVAEGDLLRNGKKKERVRKKSIEKEKRNDLRRTNWTRR